MTTAYLNGKFLPLEDAKVSVMDRGFLFGDGVYEVIPSYGGHLLRMAHHLKRLQNSLDAIRIPNPLTKDQWSDILSKLVTENEGTDQALYLQVTRGASNKRDHAFSSKLTPTVFAMSSPLSASVDIENESGIKTITLDDTRWKLCNIKAITLLPNVLLRQEAVDNGTAEAILIKDGYIIEGAASNVFIVLNNILITPPNSPSLLPGITRDLILELAANNSIPFREADISIEDFNQASEVWVTSSSREISPVTQVDERIVGTGTPGPIWENMIQLYQDYKAALRTGAAD